MLLITAEILFLGFTRSPCNTLVFSHKFRLYAPRSHLNVNRITITNRDCLSRLQLIMSALQFKAMDNTVSPKLVLFMSPKFILDFCLLSGYIESAASSAISSTPFYTYTIGDTSSIYHTLQIANPSLPFCTVLSRVHRNHAILAVAPETASNSALIGQANSMRSYFISQCDQAATANSTAIDYSTTIVYFDSQDDLESYITDRDYDEVGYGYGKVNNSEPTKTPPNLTFLQKSPIH